MKNLNEYLISEKNNDNAFVKLNKVSYAMITTYYGNNENMAYLFSSLDEIEEAWHDWDFDEDKINEYMDIINNLKINEVTVIEQDKNAYYIISRLK